jgi:membrane protease YdiL (CAAX protease family)
VAPTTSRRQSQSSAAPFSVGTLVAGLAGGLTIVSIMSMIGGPLASLDVLPSETRLWIAFGLLVCVALLSGFVVAVWRAPAGLAAAILTGLSAALLPFLIRTLLLAEGPYNRLVFGPTGLIAVALAATAGGWIAHLLDGDRLHARYALSDAARVGLWAACLWVSFELVARLVGATGLGPIIGNVLVADMLAILIGMPTASWIIAHYGQANSITAETWEYRWTPLPVGIGVTAGALALGMMWVTAQIDQALWGLPEAALASFAEGLQAGTWVAVLMLVANGLVAPASEELAWRGVVQTALVRAWGPMIGIVVTALLFALKHVVLDGSLARMTTLVMLGLVLGVVRHRWGTGSSTIAHTVVNLASTSLIVASA